MSVIDEEMRSTIMCFYKLCICQSDILLALEPPNTDSIRITKLVCNCVSVLHALSVPFGGNSIRMSNEGNQEESH